MMAADPKQKQRQRQEEPPKPNAPSHYKGFTAGVFSGVAKLAGMCSCLLLPVVST